MENAEAVLSVKFNSIHSSGELMNFCQQDMETFRKVHGLIQKYYFAEELTGAICGIYIFQSKEAREAFWASELAKHTSARYGVIPNTLRVELYEMAMVLNDVILV